ncbi:MAG: hypothetical protein ACON4N_07415 [Myxococcota bacterium]
MNLQALEHLRQHDGIVFTDAGAVEFHRTTRMEHLWGSIFWLAVVGLVASLVLYLTGGRVPLLVVGLEIGALVVGRILMVNTNHHVVLDVHAAQLYEHWHVFRTRMRPLCNAHEVLGVGVSAEFYASDYGSEWRYHTVILLPSRQLLRLTDGTADMHKMNTFAKALSSLWECPYYEGRERASMRVDLGDSSGVTVQFEKNGRTQAVVRYVGHSLLLGGVLGLGYVIYIYALA